MYPKGFITCSYTVSYKKARNFKVKKVNNYLKSDFILVHKTFNLVVNTNGTY